MKSNKFKGKRTSDGSWVFGDFCTHPEVGNTIIDHNQPILQNNVIYLGTEIALETVGQFTGLTDKNGIEIYIKSDIFKHNNNKYIFVNTDNFGLIAVVINKNIGNIIDDGILMMNHNYRDFNHIYRIQKYIEVIGNIHDNPELMK